MKTFLFAMLLVASQAVTLCYGQNKTTNSDNFKTTYQTAKGLVASENFKFVGELLYDGKKREQIDADVNYFTINKNSIIGQLKANSKDDNVMTISGKVKRFKAVFNDDKQKISVDFVTSGTLFHIQVLPNGRALVTMDTAATDSLSWIGSLKSL